MKTFGTILFVILTIGATIFAVILTIKLIKQFLDIKYYKKHGTPRPHKEKKTKKKEENPADE